MYVVQFPTPLQTKKRMHSMRIIQRNLVYIVGMVREDAVEDPAPGIRPIEHRRDGEAPLGRIERLRRV